MTDTLQAEAMSEEDFLAHMAETDPDWLEHFGVKGMQWGKRKSPEERAANDKAIDKARADYALNARSNYVQAKGAYKSAKGNARAAVKEAKATGDKNAVARTKARADFDRAKAKAAFEKVKARNVATYDKANEAKSGRETVLKTLATVASIAIVVGSVAAKSR